ncbi:hypothetical protein BEP19_16870 [Ammoniphilus oxalaticus]|uniref:Uncharacterized protein n=1 Tax=Ammoniphilus oxalaticus TaxID=66863 RepID=A0A419SQ57_9BACL|nr:hypothetical protein [Ammoniphilus oxalaticus]RKD26509.1 hypothetical protein BEP19_16870 [Ammoniphilus oxalaticus]
MNFIRSLYIRKILWLVGLIILSIISLNFENQLKQTASETFDTLSVFWSKPIISVLFGFYVSLIFVKKWSININLSLLWCVAIPCTLVSFGYPILATLSSIGLLPENIESSPVPFWLLKLFLFDVFGIITGLTLILGFFSQNQE